MNSIADIASKILLWGGAVFLLFAIAELCRELYGRRSSKNIYASKVDAIDFPAQINSAPDLSRQRQAQRNAELEELQREIDDHLNALQLHLRDENEVVSSQNHPPVLDVHFTDIRVDIAVRNARPSKSTKNNSVPALAEVC